MKQLEIQDDLISYAAAAKEIGLHRSTIKRQADAGEIRSHGGKVRLSEVLADRAANIDLTRSRRHRGDVDAVATVPMDATATRADASEAENGGDDRVIVDGKPLSYAEARTLKETYLAKLRQIEFEQRSGLVVPIDAVVSQVAGEYAVVRNKMLAMPSELSARLVGRTAEDINGYLQDKIREALANLSDPGAVALKAAGKTLN